MVDLTQGWHGSLAGANGARRAGFRAGFFRPLWPAFDERQQSELRRYVTGLIPYRVQRAARPAARIARQTRSGVAGMSIRSMPSGARASTIALMIVCGAPMQPASPEPLSPSGVAPVGSSAS